MPPDRISWAVAGIMLLLATASLFPSPSNASDERRSGDIWPRTEAPAFVSGCVTRDDPHIEDGVRFALIVSERSGVFFQIQNGDAHARSGVRYEADTGEFRLVDPLGGLWSRSFISDVVKSLRYGKFRLEKTPSQDVVTEIADGRVCDIAYLSLHHYDRFYEHVDPRTGDTVAVDHVPQRRLDSKLLQQLKSWRNEYGMPWSAAGHDSELTISGQHFHSVRLGIAGLLTTAQLWKELIDTIDGVARKQGLSRFEWAQRHISHFAGLNDRFLLWESFAWFASPHYEAGSLPSAAERLLARMERAEHLEAAVSAGEHPGFWAQEIPLSERLPDILRSLRQASKRHDKTAPQEWHPLAGFDVRYFLDWRKLERQRAGR